MNGRQSKKPFNPIGFYIGMGFGIIYGVLIDNLAIGIAIGSGISISLTVAFNTEKNEIDPQKTKIGIGLFYFGVIALAIIFLIRFY